MIDFSGELTINIEHESLVIKIIEYGDQGDRILMAGSLDLAELKKALTTVKDE